MQADGGTLFLDEIGDMPLALQTRLLRVLEKREVWPLGAPKPVPVDFRLDQRDPPRPRPMAEAGGFRADLYFRLRGLEVELPALRERADKADVIAHIAAEEAPNCRLHPTAWKMLLAHPFPGNMRQLRHVLRLAGCTAEDGVITEADLDLPPCGGSAVAGSRSRRTRNVIASAARPWRPRHGSGAGAEPQPRHALPQDQGAEDRDGAVARRLRKIRSSSSSAP